MLRHAFRETVISDRLDSVIRGNQGWEYPIVISTVSSAMPRLADQDTNPALRIVNDCLPGDLLIAIARRNSGSGTATWPSTAPDDWTEILDNNADASDDSVHAAWHRVNNRETSAYVFPTFTTSTRTLGACMMIRNGGTPVLGGISTATTTSANPGNLAPGLGALNFLWIAVMTAEGGGPFPDPPDAPTNYSANFQVFSPPFDGGGAANITIAFGTRELNASSEDPGGFGTHTNAVCTSFTIAVPPT